MINKARLIFALVGLFVVLGFYLASNINFKTDLSAYSLATQKDLDRYELLQASFVVAESDRAVIILENHKGWNTFKSFQLLGQIVSFWEDRPEVTDVASITNVIYPRKGVLNVTKEPFLNLENETSFNNRYKDWTHYSDITRKFISDNQHYAVLFIATTNTEGLSQSSFEAFEAFESFSSIQAHFLQNGLIQQEIERITRNDTVLLSIVSILLILLSFYLLTKSLKGILLIFLMVCFNLAATLVFMLYMDIPFTIHMITVPCIVIVLSFTDIMHIMYHHGVCAGNGLTGSALYQRLKKLVQLPMLMTSITSMIGFFVFFLLSENDYLTNFSLVAMVGVGIAFLSSRYLIIYALVEVKPLIKRTNYRRLDVLHQKFLKAIHLRYKVVALVLVVLFSILISVVAGKFKIDSSEGELMKNETQVTYASSILAEHFFGDKQAEIIIKLGERELWSADILHLIDSLTVDVNRIFTPAYTESPSVLVRRYRRFTRNGHPKAFTLPIQSTSSLRKDLNAFASNFGGNGILSTDRKSVKIAFGYHDRGLEVSLSEYKQMNEVLSNYGASGLEFELTGRSLLADEGSYAFTTKIIIGLLVSVLMASLLIKVFVKSLKLSLGLIFVNLFPIVTVLAIMLMIDIAITPLTLFFLSLLAGICVDDSIYLVLQKKNERQGLHVFPIAVTSIVLAVGFIAMYFSNFEWIRPFSWIFLIGIITAFLMDIIVLPFFMNIQTKTSAHD